MKSEKRVPIVNYSLFIIHSSLLRQLKIQNLKSVLKDILNFRRAVRYYAPTPISEEKVRECLKLATLAPTGFNMQLYELYHITDKGLLEKLAQACLGQLTATTAQQMVVFVTRQDKHRQHAKAILEFERGNIQRNSPA